ncbi:MAG: IS66 family transposase zinc-finger binding domain-containing protein, partial [Bryobacterales bacterium]|nr:IS66 family transposase zinc-finger binding domain-containing protein [Bryobacterales bacterium]
MPVDPKQLPQDPQLLQQMVLELVAQLDQSEARRIKTERLLRQLLESRTGRKSEDLSAEQLALFAAELERQGVNLQDGPEPPAQDSEPPPAPGGSSTGASHGRRELPRNLKRERIVHDLAEADKHCAACDQDLRLIGEETSERYEFVPAHLLVIEDVCRKYAC